MMNRRSFFKSIAKGVLATAATFYAPRLTFNGVPIVNDDPLLDVAPTSAYRLSEAEAFLEAMNRKIAHGLFYGDPANDPKEFAGFEPRYSKKTVEVVQWAVR